MQYLVHFNIFNHKYNTAISKKERQTIVQRIYKNLQRNEMFTAKQYLTVLIIMCILLNIPWKINKPCLLFSAYKNCLCFILFIILTHCYKHKSNIDLFINIYFSKVFLTLFLKTLSYFSTYIFINAHKIFYSVLLVWRGMYKSTVLIFRTL